MDLLIVVFDLRDRRERNLHDLAICNLDLYAGSGEGLGGFHAANCSTHAPPVGRYDLYIVLAIKGLQSCECLGDFHNSVPPGRCIRRSLITSDIALYGAGSLSAGGECNRKTRFGV